MVILYSSREFLLYYNCLTELNSYIAMYTLEDLEYSAGNQLGISVDSGFSRKLLCIANLVLYPYGYKTRLAMHNNFREKPESTDIPS